MSTLIEVGIIIHCDRHNHRPIVSRSFVPIANPTRCSIARCTRCASSSLARADASICRTTLPVLTFLCRTYRSYPLTCLNVPRKIALYMSTFLRASPYVQIFLGTVRPLRDFAYPCAILNEEAPIFRFISRFCM